MKATTIIEIESILKHKVSIVSKNYEDFKHSMEEKHNTEWLDTVMTDTEGKIYDELQSELIKLRSIYEDFMSHQW